MEQVRELVAELTQAFPSEPLDLSKAFEGTVYLDEERMLARFQQKPWTALAQSDLKFHADALSFLSTNAYAALLPAFLRAALEPTEGLDTMPHSLVSSLRPSQRPGKHDAMTETLTTSQRQIVARALIQFAALPDYLVSETAGKALDEYWMEQLKGEGTR